MRHILRAALVFGLASSSAALAGSGSKQTGLQDEGAKYEKLSDGYRQTEKKTQDGTTVKVTVEQKGWKSWAEARNRELQQAKADAMAAQERVRTLEAQLAEAQSQQQQQQLSSIGEVKQDDRGVILTLTGGVLFTFGSDELMPQAEERLDNLAQVLKQSPDAKFKIEGHTDSKGSEEYNQELSERRAKAVKDYLVSKGVSEQSIETEGFGEQRAVATNDTPEGRANNRRVEVVLPEGSLGIGGAGGAGTEQQQAPAESEEKDKHLKHQ